MMTTRENNHEVMLILTDDEVLAKGLELVGFDEERQAKRSCGSPSLITMVFVGQPSHHRLCPVHLLVRQTN
jgi:hypothetical protein